MNEINRLFFYDKFIILNLIAGLFLNLLIWIALLIFLNTSDYSIPLHYNIYFGIDKVGRPTQAYFLGGFAWLSLFINTFLSWRLVVKAKFLSYFLLLVALMVQILMLVSVGSLIYINN